MKRFDRAMYAFFLLALLADVARANVPAQVGGDSAGGLILSSAGQLRVGPASGAVRAVLVRRRANGPHAPAAGVKRYGLTLSRWAGILAERTHPSAPVVLAAASVVPDAVSGSAFHALFQSASPSLAIFGHLGSPAP